jgi:hypothetical protein
MSEYYQYARELPEYEPNKFDIVYGPTQVHGGAEFLGGVADLLNDIIVDSPGIISVGAFEYMNKSASTVDDRLIAMFGQLSNKFNKPMASTNGKKCKHSTKQSKKKSVKPKINKKHANKKLISRKKAPNRGLKRGGVFDKMCETGDEILYYCPNIAISGSGESGSDSAGVNSYAGDSSGSYSGGSIYSSGSYSGGSYSSNGSSYSSGSGSSGNSDSSDTDEIAAAASSVFGAGDADNTADENKPWWESDSSQDINDYLV